MQYDAKITKYKNISALMQLPFNLWSAAAQYSRLILALEG
jgi:hypothetical protein